jgi:hypothetical protein
VIDKQTELRIAKLPRGSCYAAAMLMLENTDLPIETCRLCHGVARLTVPPYCEFGHAWVEVEDGGTFIFDGRFPTTWVPKSVYFAVGQIRLENVKRYTLSEARKMVLETEHYGPWDTVVASAAHRKGK